MCAGSRSVGGPRKKLIDTVKEFKEAKRIECKARKEKVERGSVQGVDGR